MKSDSVHVKTLAPQLEEVTAHVTIKGGAVREREASSGPSLTAISWRGGVEHVVKAHWRLHMIAEGGGEGGLGE